MISKNNIFTLIVFVTFIGIHSVETNAQRGPSTVAVSKIISSNQSASMQFIGTVTPINNSVIGSAVDGRVEKIFVDAGDKVLKESSKDETIAKFGQPLLQLRTGTLQIQIDAAEIDLKTQVAALEELQTSLPIEIEQAEATVKDLSARLKYSKSKYDRMERLFRNGGGSTANERDEAFSNYRSAEESLKASNAMLRKLVATKEKRLAGAKSLVEAKRTEIRRLQDLKSKYTIRAPFDGYVVSRTANVGQWISQGEDVFQVVQLDPIEVVIKVPQSSVQQLQVALEQSIKAGEKLPAQVQVDGMPNVFEGSVHRIVPQADLRSRSFSVRVRLKNPETKAGHLLKAGMLARVNLSIGKKAESLFVEKDALVLGDEQITIVIAEKGEKEGMAKVRPVPIQVGGSIKNWISIRGSIKKDDLVIVEGNERLRPGQEVKITETRDNKLPSGR